MKRPAAVLHDARKAIERSKRSVEEARLTIERAHRTLAVSQHQLDRLKLLQARIEWLNNAQWALWGGGDGSEPAPSPRVSVTRAGR